MTMTNGVSEKPMNSMKNVPIEKISNKRRKIKFGKKSLPNAIRYLSEYQPTENFRGGSRTIPRGPIN